MKFKLKLKRVLNFKTNLSITKCMYVKHKLYMSNNADPVQGKQIQSTNNKHNNN